MSCTFFFFFSQRISQGKVFSAVEQPAGRVVAVKKSRVSVRCRRTPLQYEAMLLSLLQGHSSIPQVFALGRFEHFEYMSMELLGPSIRCTAENRSQRNSAVANVACQMISALHHVHRRGFVHRDIKPANIVSCVNAPLHMRLIDFGIARPLPKRVDSTVATEPSFVVGTLNYASLNAHQGMPLTRRDDLESLAYTLFSLLREDGLPWDEPYPSSATSAFIRRQVLLCKRSWSGKQLADGYNPLFGAFLDYARNLSPDTSPDYTIWEHGFSQLVDPTLLDLQDSVAKPQAKRTAPHKFTNGSPVLLGQLVYVRLLPHPSIAGYSVCQAPPDKWFDDPTLTDTAWPTTFLPAVVLSASRDYLGRWNVELAALSICAPDSDANTVQVPADKVIGAGWPNRDFWCSAYARTTFVWTPNQDVPIPMHWSLDINVFDIAPLRTSSAAASAFVKARNISQNVLTRDIYVEGRPLSPATLSLSTPHANWEAPRAWHDELLPIARRRVRDLGRLWTKSKSDALQLTPTDSYSQEDLTDWRNVQQERGESATLGSAREDLNGILLVQS
ncbi:kinase-like domain-containing protein [Mycena crocata]|nr:kinase-like domain-containing protein [Mycena crocata]